MKSFVGFAWKISKRITKLFWKIIATTLLYSLNVLVIQGIEKPYLREQDNFYNNRNNVFSRNCSDICQITLLVRGSYSISSPSSWQYQNFRKWTTCWHQWPVILFFSLLYALVPSTRFLRRFTWFTRIKLFVDVVEKMKYGTMETISASPRAPARLHQQLLQGLLQQLL